VEKTVGKSEVAMIKRWRNENQDGKWYSFKDGVVPFIYSEDFNLLWGLDRGVQGQTEGIASIIDGLKKRPADAGELTIMILWDDQPREQNDAPYDMGRFVGPHDWAMALTWGLYYLDDDNAMQGPHHPKVRFIIYDAFGGDRAPNASFAVKALFSLKNALPWFYVDTIAGQAQIEQALRYEINRNNKYWKDIQGLETVEDILARTTTTHREDVAAMLPTHRNAIRFVRELWCGHNVFRAGDRHAVSNLLAPLRLASVLPGGMAQVARGQIAGNTTKMRQALRDIVDLALPDGGGLDWYRDEEVRFENRIKKICKKVKKERVRFVLVDDHFDLGYHHILGNMLFCGDYNPGGLNVVHRQNPGNLPERRWKFEVDASSLECFSNLNGWLQDRVQIEMRRRGQNDTEIDTEIGACDVLFLDLRLWDNIEQGLSVMRPFLETISTNIEDRGLIIQDLNFSIARQEATRAIAQGLEIPPKALALLPLFLSHIDQRLPIILFSSTHQWVVLNMLKHRPNIITYFSKPMDSGYEERLLLKHSAKSLASAIKDALLYMRYGRKP